MDQSASHSIPPSQFKTVCSSLSLSLSFSLPPSPSGSLSFFFSPFSLPLFLFHSTYLFFTPANVYINPIADIDISDKSVGETLSFACSVFTCQGSVEVAILKGSQLLAERNFPDGEDVWVPISLTISEDTADTYVCLVVLPDGRTFNETFMITGMCTMYAIPLYCVMTRPYRLDPLK